ncbi:MAG: SOS response-associated peptidase [Gammaproteobacteria bacterium]|nr:SOS response-associated peptidase [Gammaproteobacteria bacterium]MBU2478148.1 SOS response-associated peptidase [Gammaproteobacteria bacterium]
MCGRFARTSPVETFATLFHAQSTDELDPAYNIAPTQNLLVARNTPSGIRELVNLHWGLVPHWSKGPDAKYSMINARADTLAKKPAYRDPVKQRRCLIAADGFYEWKKTGSTKQPYFIRLRGGQPCAFAGLWDHWEIEGEPAIESCTIITCDANQLVAGIHDRMPVILPPRLYDSWMNPKLTYMNALSDLLKPYPDTLMEAWPVGRSVNNPKNDSADLLEPVPEAID